MKKLLSIVLVGLLCASCNSYKNVPYLKGEEAYKEIVVNELNGGDDLFDARIQPKDLLSISVNTTDPLVAAPFNLTMQTAQNAAQRNSTYQQPALMQYLVDNDGSVDFPVIGRITLGGMTKNEAENLIREKLKPYLKEVPIVTVRMANYKISVIGEVNRPGTFTISNEKVNVLEALAMAGDMTVYGIRSNVKLIRENNQGERQVIALNLNDENVLHSKYYYLQQNDILYVTPNKTKAKNADISNSTTIWFSVVSTLVSLTTLLINILK